MKKFGIMVITMVVLLSFHAATATAAPAIKKQVSKPAVSAPSAAGSLVQTASKIEVKNLTAPVGKDITLEARLITNKGELLGGKMIEFKVNNKPIGSFPTAGAGTASAGTAKAPFHVSGDYPPGVYKIEARFSGDAAAGMGHGQGTLTVVKSKTKIELQMDESYFPAVIGGRVVVKGVLINLSNPSSWINDRLVTLRSNRNKDVKTAKTYSHGNFHDQVMIPLDLSPPTSFNPKVPFTVEAEFGGDTYFEPFKQTFTFYSRPQPPPIIEGHTLMDMSGKYLKLKGKNFMPSFLDANWTLWMKEYKNNWVQVFADDGKGIKKVPFSGNSPNAVSMFEIHLDVSSIDLHSCKFKVVREKSESNLYPFTYIYSSDVKIKSIEPARTKVGDPEQSFYISLLTEAFSWVNNDGTKVKFANEEFLPDKKLQTGPNEGWVKFYVPVKYRNLPGSYPIQVVLKNGFKSNAVSWELAKGMVLKPATMKATPKKLK